MSESGGGAPSADENGEEEIKLNAEQALELAMKAHKTGYTEQAKSFYEAVLHIAPDSADARHYYGVLQHQLGNTDLGLEHIDRSLELAPDFGPFYMNRGNLLKEQGRHQEAEQAYRRCLALSGESADVLCNIGAALHAQDQDDEAKQHLKRALELEPEHGESNHNLGNIYREERRFEEAIDCYSKAVEFGGYQHNTGRTARNLAIVLATFNRLDEAEQVLRNWLARDPDNPVATHLLAAMTGAETPERASNEFVVNSFQDYAASFDVSLARLKYQAPKLVGERIRTLIPQAKGDLLVCDLGCGTGLVAEHLAPYASRLIGVDLSVSMLTQAKKRDLYHELVEEELGEFLSASQREFGLLTCVDTFCYLGRLDEAIAAAGKTMATGGLLCFTVEKAEEDAAGDYTLAPHGRYQHKKSYLEALLTQNQFVDQRIDEVHLRNEGGLPVQGWLVSAWQKEQKSV